MVLKGDILKDDNAQPETSLLAIKFAGDGRKSYNIRYVICAYRNKPTNLRV